MKHRSRLSSLLMKISWFCHWISVNLVANGPREAIVDGQIVVFCVYYSTFRESRYLKNYVKSSCIHLRLRGLHMILFFFSRKKLHGVLGRYSVGWELNQTPTCKQAITLHCALDPLSSMDLEAGFLPH